MAWTADFPDFEEARERAQRAMTLPIGLASPLWMAFGAAATAGVAYWWMTRWTRALNVEALAGTARHAAETAEAVQEVVAETVRETVQVADPAVAEATAHVADDLTALTGVGPKLAAALAERGVTRFAELAAWSEHEARAFDDELSLKGRVLREEWVAQARRMIAGEA
jgi:predicted flap endonuclease-1-like 5' DNA nuclease